MHDADLSVGDYSATNPGMNLVRLRELRGLSQADLADMVGLAGATYQCANLPATRLGG